MADIAIKISYILRAHCLPFIIVFGLLFNLLSFFVMRRIKTPTSFYITILGLSDTG
jgi:hypothetical protein